ncbi:MAG: hypothetical protein JW741_10645 [Sedimentisphaerales bacterium]|nr:hypothetical protein [Sedimentisphaerales bacterium]
MEGSFVPGVFEIVIILFVMVFGVVGALVTVIPFWKICTKAGFPGPLALLMLVPIANIILPFYIAFAEWPVLRQGGGAPATPDFT